MLLTVPWKTNEFIQMAGFLFGRTILILPKHCPQNSVTKRLRTTPFHASSILTIGWLLSTVVLSTSIEAFRRLHLQAPSHHHSYNIDFEWLSSGKQTPATETKPMGMIEIS